MIDCIHSSLNNKDMSIVLKRTGCDSIDKYLKQVEEKDSSIIQQLFLTFTLNQYMDPVTLKMEFYKIEHEYKIELSIPNQKKVSLYDCFLETFKDESLDGENAWFDEKENRKKHVIKRSALAYMPTLLCIHLKRWNPDFSKKSTYVETPFILDITPFTIYNDSTTYQLFGIMNHDGNNQGGHYYSYILREESWFSLNDHFIQSISTENIIHKSNYCLFYRKIKK
jgi:ubiquitin C-terminal hydrolase